MIDLEELSHFLIRARREKSTSEEKECIEKRAELTLFTYLETPWEYSSQSSGFFMTSETEIVKDQKKVIWTMSCAGGMLPSHHENEALTLKTYSFLKRALLRMHPLEPYRGPNEYTEKEFEYTNSWEGNLAHIFGRENILYEQIIIYEQNYMGGLII